MTCLHLRARRPAMVRQVIGPAAAGGEGNQAPERVWLVAEGPSGSFAPWSWVGRSMRLGRQVLRQQKVLDRALARAERGERDDTIPSLPQ